MGSAVCVQTVFSVLAVQEGKLALFILIQLYCSILRGRKILQCLTVLQHLRRRPRRSTTTGWTAMKTHRLMQEAPTFCVTEEVAATATDGPTLAMRAVWREMTED